MKPRVAVLDDEPRMVDIIGMVLRRQGYEVETFSEPDAVLEAVEKRPFDVLLTDLRMPGMDGVEVLGRALEIDPELPVILITAHATRNRTCNNFYLFLISHKLKRFKHE